MNNDLCGSAPLLRPCLDRRGLVKCIAGMGLSFTVPGLDARAAEQRGDERPKSLITLWLDGGPSQLETWDPHPATAIGGPTRGIRTTIPDVQIAEHYPLVAEQLEHLSAIRSLVSKEGDHERACYLLKTGYRPDPTLQHPSLGAIIAHQHPNHQLDLPQFITLGYDPHPSRGGYLGSKFDSFQFSNPGESLQNLEPRVDADRQRRRLANLQVVGRTFRNGRATELDKTLYEHALSASLNMMTTQQLRAFQMEDEPQAVREAYGDSTFGRGCLIARRLVEQGVRAINVVLQNFDSHEDNFSRHRENAAMLDPAFARLVVELRERDLWQSTLVLCIGEFGRTPRINASDGRDHWPHGFSCLLGGAGLNSGVRIGATDPEGQRKEPEDPIEVADLNATVLSALDIDYSAEMQTPIGRPMKLSAGTPISRLF